MLEHPVMHYSNIFNGEVSGSAVLTIATPHLIKPGRREIVEYCDLYCRYAEIPKDYGVDGSGSCRTFMALYCTLKRSLVDKNRPCREKVPREDRRED